MCPEVLQSFVAFGNGRGVNHKRVAWVGAIGGYEFCALVVTNFHSFALKFVGECGAVGDWYYTYELTKMPTGGNVRFLDNGTFVYTAGRKFVGEDSFSYDILLNGELIGSNDVTVVVSAAQEDESVADVTSVTAESEVPSNEGKIKWYVISAVILLGLVGIAVYFMVKRAGGK